MKLILSQVFNHFALIQFGVTLLFGLSAYSDVFYCKNVIFLFFRMTSRGAKSTVADATPAMLMVIAVFALPAKYRFWPFRCVNYTLA